MLKLKFYKADTDTRLSLQFADGGVQAGFPSPAQDYISESFDLNRELIEHPSATFYARVVGDSMAGEGIIEGDILVIDRSIDPEHGDLAVCCLDGEFTLKRLRIEPGRLWLMPSNKRYEPIEVLPEMDFKVWGVVLYTIKSNRRLPSRSRQW